jgi:hypothetical protein
VRETHDAGPASAHCPPRATHWPPGAKGGVLVTRGGVAICVFSGPSLAAAPGCVVVTAITRRWRLSIYSVRRREGQGECGGLAKVCSGGHVAPAFSSSGGAGRAR